MSWEVIKLLSVESPMRLKKVLEKSKEQYRQREKKTVMKFET